MEKTWKKTLAVQPRRAVRDFEVGLLAQPEHLGTRKAEVQARVEELRAGSLWSSRQGARIAGDAR